MEIFYTWECHNCENGPCQVAYRDATTKPRSCPTMGTFGSTDWNQIVSPTDKLEDLMTNFEAFNEAIQDRNYPDWWYRLIYGLPTNALMLVERYCNFLQDEMYIRSFDSSSEADKELRKHKKEEIASAFARLGFQMGLVYGEYRRKVEGLEDIELAEA